MMEPQISYCRKGKHYTDTDQFSISKCTYVKKDGTTIIYLVRRTTCNKCIYQAEKMKLIESVFYKNTKTEVQYHTITHQNKKTTAQKK